MHLRRALRGRVWSAIEGGPLKAATSVVLSLLPPPRPPPAFLLRRQGGSKVDGGVLVLGEGEFFNTVRRGTRDHEEATDSI